MKARTFADSVVLHATSGNGGDGCTSFRREKYVPKGGPDGGDGGHGGHVILCASHEEDSLLRLYFAPHQRAPHGEPGRGKQLDGRGGADLRLAVPCGTVVHDMAAGTILADLVADGDEYVAARGGKGGLGNCHFKSSTHQTPYEHTDGEPGESVTLRLELKLMADAGLVGLPNAGKSSLLRALSAAHPKIGAYPFTTLNPIVGTLVFDDYSRIRIGDIPGLVAGAHQGAGLGDAFLRHVERARTLVAVIDMAGTEGRNPQDDLAVLIAELRAYRAELLDRPFLCVANKMDLPGASEKLAEFRDATGVDPLPVSAESGDGIEVLKTRLRVLTHQEPELQAG